jgi:hypothetical protein
MIVITRTFCGCAKYVQSIFNSHAAVTASSESEPGGTSVLAGRTSRMIAIEQLRVPIA